MTGHAEIEALIARIALADRRAFHELYARTSAKLFGICLRVLNDRTEAEAALQDVFLRIWAKAGRYPSSGHSPMTWLVTLARNIAIDRLRRRSGQSGTGAIDAADLVADPAPGPEAQWMAATNARSLDRCLGQLQPDRAAMLRRACLDGATYAELAAASGVKRDTLRTWLRRSLIELRRCLSR